jgi:hypothetical protein
MESKQRQEQQWAADLKKALHTSGQPVRLSLDEEKKQLHQNMTHETQKLRILLKQKAPKEKIDTQIQTIIQLRAEQLSLLIQTLKKQPTQLDEKTLTPYIQAYYTDCYTLVHSIDAFYDR